MRLLDEQILKAALEKAMEAGWQMKGCPPYTAEYLAGIYCVEEEYFCIIFSHDFAKAFFGRKKTGAMFATLDGSDPHEVEEWELHLSTMVLEKKPLQYIKKFL